MTVDSVHGDVVNPSQHRAHLHTTGPAAFSEGSVASALRSLSSDDFAENRQVLAHAGLCTESTVFSYVGLLEPDKRTLLDRLTAPRRVRSFLIDFANGDSFDVVVDLDSESLVSAHQLDQSVDGGVPVVLDEFGIVPDLVKADARWQEAMARRGLDEFSQLRINPLSAGILTGDEVGRRVQRCFTFVDLGPDDLAWAHPVDGVVAVVDVIERRVLDVVDYVRLDVPMESGSFHLASWRGPDRIDLKPIEIGQPDGPSFTIDKNGVLQWAGWSMQVGFDQREGLIFHNVAIEDSTGPVPVVRPVIYRASIAEMVVPYGDPSPQRWFQNFFDCGEYLLGGFANSLELGCDCVGDITYLDAVVADQAGHPRSIPQAICIHEEDAGILWKHSDNWNGSSESRRNRRLVVSFFVTVGNYDYGFYWYFGLDGTIQFEVKATGVVFTSGYPGDGYLYATEVAPGLGAPNHQHLFSARLDMMIDGIGNSVDELEAAVVPRGKQNPSGSGFTQIATRLRSESDGHRMADNRRNVGWHILNPAVTNRLGKPVGWLLLPEGKPVLLAQESSDIHARATFAAQHLWVTAYDPAEQYPAGDFVNYDRGGHGLPEWIAADRSIDGADIVLWHTFGLTHFPRMEDWPIMSVDTAGFTLKPHGFFGRNPALNIPASHSMECHPHSS
jgi:primary-amine oxidase